jgi:hypothetical protein
MLMSEAHEHLEALPLDFLYSGERASTRDVREFFNKDV